MFKKKVKISFTLIEVLIVVSILSVFLVFAAAVATTNLRNMKIQEHKILATYYAEEAKEQLTHLKENDWNSFKDKATGTIYCLNNLPDNYDWQTGNCSSFSLNSFYKREATLTNNNNEINVLITVSWQELNRTYAVNLPIIFTIWE